MATVDVIAHTEVGAGGTANITFSSIPATFDDLWLQLSIRVATAGTYVATVAIQVNTTTTGYSNTTLKGYGTTATSDRDSNQSYWRTIQPAATATASTFGSFDIYIPAYKNTSNFKQLITNYTAENNSASDYQLGGIAGLWRNTAAINSIKIYEQSSNNLVQYSTATLYGITKA
jgi:hypothetical protein